MAQLEPPRRSLHQPPPVSDTAAAAIVAATRCHAGELMCRHPERRVTNHTKAARRKGRRRRPALELPRRHVDFRARGAVNLVGGNRAGWGDQAGRGRGFGPGGGKGGAKTGAGVRAAADLDVVDLDLLNLLAAPCRALRSLALRASRGRDTATTAAAALATHVVATALTRLHHPHLFLNHLAHRRTYLIAHRRGGRRYHPPLTRRPALPLLLPFLLALPTPLLLPLLL